MRGCEASVCEGQKLGRLKVPPSPSGSAALGSHIGFSINPRENWLRMLLLASAIVSYIARLNIWSQECIATVTRVRVCNYVKLETGWNLPPVLKIVTCNCA